MFRICNVVLGLHFVLSYISSQMFLTNGFLYCWHNLVLGLVWQSLKYLVFPSLLLVGLFFSIDANQVAEMYLPFNVSLRN